MTDRTVRRPDADVKRKGNRMNARFFCAAALASLGLAAPAAAAPYHVVYDAVITAGSDVDGLFGLTGQDLAGLNLRADVTYLTTVPGTRTTLAGSDEVSGGEAFGTAPVISSAIFTIGTTSVALSPTFYDDVYASADFLDAYGYDELGNSFQTYIQPDLAGPTSLERAFSSTGEGDTGGLISQYSYVSIGDDLIDFDAVDVTASAVPEPAAWLVMLAGFGAAGCVTRRARRRGVALG